MYHSSFPRTGSCNTKIPICANRRISMNQVTGLVRFNEMLKYYIILELYYN